MKKKDFASLVDMHIEFRSTGYRSWFDSLDEDAKSQLSAIKDRFRSGGYGDASKAAVARAVASAAKEQGWKTAGIQAVIAWLGK